MKILNVGFSVLILGLIGCHGWQAPQQPRETSGTSRISELLAQAGGPRIISYFEAGQIEVPHEASAEGWDSGDIDVRGVRVTDGSERNVGVALFLKDSKLHDSNEKPNFSSAFLDAQEAYQLESAIGKEIDYVSDRQKKPPQHHESMAWRSVEGLSISVSPDSSGDSFFMLGCSSSEHNGNSNTVLMFLPQGIGKQLIVKINAALNSANSSD